MATKLREIRREYTPEQEAEIQARVKAELATISLYRLRAARELTQKRMADLLEMDQGSVSKLELRTDMHIRTLRSYIEAMGGQLHLVASFEDGTEVEVENLGLTEERELVPA